MAAALAIAGPAKAASSYVWIEAEQPIATNFPANPFAPANDTERAQLSGGAWIGASGPRKSPLFAVYDVDVPADGEYRLYARKFWKHGPYRVNFNDGPWTNIGADVALLDSAELRPNIVANWTSAGSFTLKAGRNRFRVESRTNDGAIAFDCFLLTTGPFRARGLARPDERLTSSTPGWFAWDPLADPPDSPIDLRAMNERKAGDGGWILAREGKFFHEKTGQPIRFWGINCGPDIVRLDERDLDSLAAMLARRGVNWARLHGPIFVPEGRDAGRVDEPQLRRTLRAVQILKSHGMYTTLSIYFPTWLKLDETNGWPDYRGKPATALLFFDAKLQSMYREWWRAVLTTAEPSTGICLKDEPAVLSLEMQNEDSLFFWTFQPRKTIPASTSSIIEKRFSNWLAARHGGFGKAVARWNADERVDGDDFDHGVAGVMAAGELEAHRTSTRAKDTARFLFEVERDFYQSTRAFLRDELGAKSLVSGSNWTTASDTYLTPLERAANLTGDFIDRHGYYNALHEGERAGYQISIGDSFSSRSALRFDPDRPGGKANAWNPILDTSYNDRPTMVSEIGWLEPNRFRAESPLLCAALGAQQDTDALGFFAATGPGWEATISKFSALSPVELAQWPAAAMVYRLGLVDEAPITSDSRARLDDLLDLGGLKGVDSRTKLAGRTHVDIGTETSARSDSPAATVNPIRSVTGQCSLDSARGVFVVDSPRANALVGFLSNADPHAFSTLTIRSSMEYGAIAVVPLDGQPIASSKRLLVQAMSEQQNSGFRASGDSVRKIEAVGRPPILVREIAGTITFTDGSRWRAQPLEQNGEAMGNPSPSSSTLELAPAVVAYVLTRE